MAFGDDKAVKNNSNFEPCDAWGKLTLTLSDGSEVEVRVGAKGTQLPLHSDKNHNYIIEGKQVNLTELVGKTVACKLEIRSAEKAAPKVSAATPTFL